MPWDQRGTLSVDHIPAMEPRYLKQLSDVDLAKLTGGYAPGQGVRLLCEAEQRRREAWSAPVRWSISISILALGVSVVALFR